MSGIAARRSMGLLLVLRLMLPGVAHSQAFDPVPFQTFLSSDVNKRLVTGALTSMPAEVFHTCPGLVISKAAVHVVEAIAFGADGVPTSGVWWERFPVQGCGNDTVLNIHFAATGDDNIEATATLPGSTRADPLLQRDAKLYAYVGAASHATSCRQFFVKNSQFGGYGLRSPGHPDPGNGARFRPWRETWTIVGCGRTFQVPMEFVPDATGTQVIQPQGEISEY